MIRVRRYWWLLLLGLVTALDFGGRFLLAFEMRRVALFESILFIATSVVMLALSRRYRPKALWVARTEGLVAIVFGLGAARAILLTADVRVVIANFAVLGAAIVLVAGFLVRRLAPR